MRNNKNVNFLVSEFIIHSSIKCNKYIIRSRIEVCTTKYNSELSKF